MVDGTNLANVMPRAERASHLQAKLADFGLTMKEKSSGFLGTPYWMAPELFHVGSKPSRQTDVYSFAITLFEMFTRKEPYGEHEDPEYVLEQLLLGTDAGELMRPKLPPGLPAAVKKLIEQCWHPEPMQRPSFPEIRSSVNAFDADQLGRWGPACVNSKGPFGIPVGF
jgi:serine/threonine protein kinase